jgi:hypothetical protein
MPQENISVAALVSGGEEIAITLADGKREALYVPLVPLRHAMKYVTLMENQSDFIEFACKKPEGWADTLTDDSAYAVDAKVKALNDPRIDRYMERQSVTVASLTPLAKKAKALEKSAQAV